jgi:hypothetical protein
VAFFLLEQKNGGGKHAKLKPYLTPEKPLLSENSLSVDFILSGKGRGSFPAELSSASAASCENPLPWLR